MAGSVRREQDGSVALFIRGDLQFNSKDECIYHESLVLPALALAEQRKKSPLKALIIGGGDGLVARELFKSAQMASVDLVDYDPEILKFAQGEFNQLNEGSLVDPRITIHIQDAWGFVEAASTLGTTYDLIVSDLTVPDDVTSARFHSIDWYKKLACLLSPTGVLSVNAVSPGATPRAYWSVFNSISLGGLNVRPYRVHIPSFTAQRFGPDWGFFIASIEPITAIELDEVLPLAEPRHFLINHAVLRQLFDFPVEFFQYQKDSAPAMAGSDILLRYFEEGPQTIDEGAELRSSLMLDTKSLIFPVADTGKTILPPEIGAVVAKSIYAAPTEANRPEVAQMFLYQVLDLMPSLNREHTKEVIEDFLANPESFLQAIDLGALVKRLLKRAKELPVQLVNELENLQERLRDWTGDFEALLQFGQRVVTVLMLVIVIGNLLYPDTAYGKGEHAAEARHAGGRTAHGVRGGYGGGTYWNDTTYVRKPIYYQNQVVPGAVRKVPSGKLRGPSSSLPSQNHISSTQTVDVTGRFYPSRRFRLSLALLGGEYAISEGKPEKEVTDYKGVYRLGLGADVLSTGHIAMPLTEQSYLLVSNEALHVVDQEDGNAIMSLAHDQVLLKGLADEVGSQLCELKPDQPEFSYLEGAKTIVGSCLTDGEIVGEPKGEAGVFPGVGISADGKYLVLKRASGEIAYLDALGWYKDEGITPLSEPYPYKMRSLVASYLSQLVREFDATRNRMNHDKSQLSAYLDVLSKELSNYESSDKSAVNFGSRAIPRTEAVALTQNKINNVRRKILLLDKYSEQLPGHIDLARTMLLSLASSDLQRG